VSSPFFLQCIMLAFQASYLIPTFASHLWR
jgi:hypothetical protein